MKKILVLGAGRSSGVLIRYLLQKAEQNNWFVTVADTSLEMAQEKVQGNTKAKAISFDVFNEPQLRENIEASDLVISLLPPAFHITVAKICVELSKNMITASYVSDEIAALNEEAVKKNVLILMEMGLDPGIDHMSAKKEIDEIKKKGGKFVSFKSYTGGLMSPDSDNNPWNYKFTWNPRNVVLAGQGTVKYLESKKYKYIPYQRLFERTEKFSIPGYGEFEGYANRDSLKYINVYGLEAIPDFIRGTLRRPGFCKAWNVFVQLGMTEDHYKIPNSSLLTYREFLNSFLKNNANDGIEDQFCEELKLFKSSEEVAKIRWLGLFDEVKISISNASPAQILQEILERKWSLDPQDKDMIVMQHQFEYEQEGKRKKLESSLVVLGDNPSDTAMAKTVGLPLAIAAKLILEGKLNMKGVQIPIAPEIYNPVLKELEEWGVWFENKEL